MSERESAERLVEEARRLANVATVGPWVAEEVDGSEEFFGNWLAVGPAGLGGEAGYSYSSYKPRGLYAYEPDGEPPGEDADFAAWSREGVPDLCDALSAAIEREREKDKALQDLSEAVEVYRTQRHPKDSAATMTGSEARMYQAMHKARKTQAENYGHP